MRSPGWRAASPGLGVASAALGMYSAYEFGYSGRALPGVDAVASGALERRCTWADAAAHRQSLLNVSRWFTLEYFAQGIRSYWIDGADDGVQTKRAKAAVRKVHAMRTLGLALLALLAPAAIFAVAATEVAAAPFSNIGVIKVPAIGNDVAYRRGRGAAYRGRGVYRGRAVVAGGRRVHGGRAVYARRGGVYVGGAYYAPGYDEGRYYSGGAVYGRRGVYVRRGAVYGRGAVVAGRRGVAGRRYAVRGRGIRRR
jgi:hypothetical protein